ncbi:hypothetical protein [Cryobacterium sp. CG_9.6]|uniref:hypothetical protein n=1 Tax=Cryobacterium sp. CG_9.6 TaxID=2760710 RepID=UPI0024768E93|nr:hypothetical protein [Cryobacterium sp. CG_9.6]MDH6237326.1 hypothetical protein [Cryobacterium sp. CG_9.6]
MAGTETDAASTPSPVRARKRLRLVLALALAGAIIAATAVVGVAQRTQVLTAAQVDYDAALTGYTSAQKQASASVAAGADAIAAAQETLDFSAGKVATEDSRTALAAAITDARARLAADTTVIERATAVARTAPAADTSFLSPGSGLDAATRTVASVDLPATDSTPSIADSLVAPQQAVRDAVAAWEAALYTNHVQAVGWLPELDQCVGSVDVTAYYAGIPSIAEHWSCGGKNFPDDAGTIITLTGVHSGLYRVDGIVAMLNSSRDSVADLPGGHDLLYQTCQNGQGATMSFTALTKIG